VLDGHHRGRLGQGRRGGSGDGPAADQRLAVNDVWIKARLDELLTEGMSRAELILRYTLSHPHCHTVIVGTCDLDHLTENVQAAEAGPLSAEIVDEITRRVALVLG
jgi:aryl-alcohol dehydrogenase-like predicted oxidoreductase